ncbi:MAG: YlzJ-like family protein [Bacillota bacterium]|nr:YlzJ-like family protein [Bacillota bacterium]
MLWTIAPPEMIWGEGWSRVAKPPSYEEAQVGGRRLLVERGADGRRRVVRLLSTDPADFLDARFQPGTVLPEPLPEGGGRAAI